MITFTTPVQVPNATRVKVTTVLLYDEQSYARLDVQVLSPGQTPHALRFELLATDAGSCTGLRRAGTPNKFSDIIETFVLTVPNAYSQIETAYRGGGNKANAYKAVEQKLLDLGIIDATLAGTVG